MVLSYKIIAFICFLLLIGILYDARAQNDNPNAVLDWNQVLQIVGAGGAISGVIVAVANHLFTVRRMKNEFEFKIKEHEHQIKKAFEYKIREFEYQDKKEILAAYSNILTFLHTLLHNIEFETGVEGELKIRESIRKVQDEAIKGQYNKLDNELIDNWMDFRGTWPDLYKDDNGRKILRNKVEKIKNRAKLLSDELKAVG